MRFAPATFPWLLSFEMRMAWRARARGNRYSLIIILGVIVLLGVTVGLPLAHLMRGHAPAVTTMLSIIMDIIFAVLFTLFLSQTLSASVTAFFERGDLDLLLSSPLPTRLVLAVRCLAVTLTPLLLFAGLLTPFVLPTALLGHPAWLAAYGMLTALGLCAGAAGLALSMALFAAIGPRRTKTVGQVMAAFSGAVVVLLSQSRNFFPNAMHNAMNAMARMSGGFNANGLLSWPVRAAMGEALPFTVLLGVSLLLFCVTTWLFGARFADNAAAAVGVDAPRRRKRAATAFRSGLYPVMITKELRLLLRDPALLSQVLLRALYMLPFAFLLLQNARQQRFGAVAVAAGVLAFITSQISATMAWIVISAEDAPDLIASAPLAMYRMRLAKLAAAMIPVTVLAAVPLFFLIAIAPFMGLAAMLGVIAVSLAGGALNFWYQRPGKRGKFRQRGSGALLVTIGEVGLGVLGGAATGLAAYGSLWSLLAIAVFGGVIVLLYEGRSRDV